MLAMRYDQKMETIQYLKKQIRKKQPYRNRRTSPTNQLTMQFPEGINGYEPQNDGLQEVNSIKASVRHHYPSNSVIAQIAKNIGDEPT